MLEAVFSRLPPDSSVRRALQRIINENADLHMDLGNLYGLTRHTKYAEKIQKKVVGDHQQRNCLTIPYETVQETSDRLQREKAEIEVDGKKIRELNGTEQQEPEQIDRRYIILQDKLKKSYEVNEDQKEQIKRLQKQAAFYHRGEITLEFSKLEKCLREDCYGQPPENFIVTQEKGYAVGVRAA